MAKKTKSRNIFVEAVPNLPMEEQPTELVERKGVGHPDSICDAIMDAVSVELCRAYTDHFGRVLHHNIDKGLLVAGGTSPALGGGTVDEPMRLIFGDRATYEYQGVRIPVGEIAEARARTYPQVALAWLLAQPTVVAPIIGVRTPEQLEDNLGAVGWAFTDEELTRLNEVSDIEEGYPYRMIRAYGAR